MKYKDYIRKYKVWGSDNNYILMYKKEIFIAPVIKDYPPKQEILYALRNMKKQMNKDIQYEINQIKELD